MKPKILYGLVTVILVATTFFFACRKENQTEKNQLPDIAEIQQWFNASVINASSQNEYMRNGKGMENKEVLWDKAISYKINGDNIFEIPISSQTKKGYKIHSPSEQPDSLLSIKDITAYRYLVITRHSNGKKDYAVMSVVGNMDYLKSYNYDLEGNHYKKLKKDFSGFVLFHSWDGKLLNGWIYQDGKITKQISYTPKGNSFAKEAPTPTETCTTYEVDQYCQDCTDWYVNGVYTDTQCGAAYVCDSWYVDECSYGAESGGGGGGYTAPPSNPPTITNLSMTDKLVLDTSVKPCLSAIIADIKLISSFTETVKSVFFGNTTLDVSGIITQLANSQNWKVLIKEGDLPSQYDPYSGLYAIPDATTSEQPGIVVITFDKGYINTATELSIARTLTHELIHAYFVFGENTLSGTALQQFQDINSFLYTKGGNIQTPEADAQHQQIAIKYVNGIALIIAEYAGTHNITSPINTVSLLDYCGDIAWGGLEETPAFNEFATNKTTIHEYIINEKLGNSSSTGVKCQ